jgi:hypothetical protein
MRYPSARQWAQPIIVPIVHYLDWLATALLHRPSSGGVAVPPAAGNGTLLAFVKAYACNASPGREQAID